MKLYHISEKSNIQKFEPRFSKSTNFSIVWAIEELKLPNYLLPRDCPRVTFYADKNTSKIDRDRFLGSSYHVIAIESSWYKSSCDTKLYAYSMPDSSFVLFDSVAGYYISSESVTPDKITIFENPINEIISRDVELRIVPSLWYIHDLVVNSTLQFSIIRMRNAKPR